MKGKISIARHSQHMAKVVSPITSCKRKLNRQFKKRQCDNSYLNKKHSLLLLYSLKDFSWVHIILHTSLIRQNVLHFQCWFCGTFLSRSYLKTVCLFLCMLFLKLSGSTFGTFSTLDFLCNLIQTGTSGLNAWLESWTTLWSKGINAKGQATLYGA